MQGRNDVFNVPPEELDHVHTSDRPPDVPAVFSSVLSSMSKNDYLFLKHIAVSQKNQFGVFLKKILVDCPGFLFSFSFMFIILCNIKKLNE